MGKLRSQKQEREQLVCNLRASGESWVGVATVLRQHYHLNARIALRYAHGWSQREAADAWNRRWPDELKTFKTFSYWELWPGSTGHAPTFDNLAKLAELYECAVSDLLVDLPDFRHLDAAESDSSVSRSGSCGDLVARRLGRAVDEATRGERASWDVLASLTREANATYLTRKLRDFDFTEVAQVIVMWMRQLNPKFSRRELLAKLSAAFAAATVSPLFDVLHPTEHEEISDCVRQSGQFDVAALGYVEGMITNLRQQSDVLGPQLTLQSALGHRQIAQRLARAAPETFQQRAVSAYAELTQLLGWLCFNMGDYAGAQHYYDDARGAAHEAENVELVTYILCTMSHLATWQGKPRVGIDHAVAAGVWAEQTRSPLACAYAADVAVRAYVADSQPEKFWKMLDREYSSLQAVQEDEPSAAWWYFYGESFYWKTKGECSLKLRQSDAAISAVDKSLALVDPANLHNYTFRLLLRAEARIQQSAIAEASGIIGDVARMTVGNSSQRIAQRVTDVRRLLKPWERTKTVRELDELLTTYRPTGGSGNTNRTYSL